MQQAELVAEGVDEVLDPKARDIFIENSKKTLTDAYVRGLIDKDLVKAEEVVEGDSLKGFLSPQEILKYRAAVEDAKVRMESATLRKLNEDKEAAVLDRELGIFRGEATQLDLDDDLDRGVYGKEEYLSLSKKLRAEQGTQRATDLSIQDINARQQAGVPFDTTKKSVKDQLDNYFTTIVRPSITEENAEEVIGTFVEQFDYLPSTVKSGLLASLHNGSKQQTTIAATTIDGLIKRDPSIARQFNSTRDLARVRQISSSLSAGMPADLAIQGADNLLVEKGTTEFKERDRAFKDLDREFDQDELTSLFVNDPENVPEGMSRDWNILFREFAVNNKMDFDDARQLAYDITKSTWGISTATGEERYMKHSPENYYNKRGLNPKWIGIQLDSDIKGIKSDITDFDITALPDTIGTDNPGYSVNYLSPEGIPLMLRDEEGRLLIWRPDIEASEDVKKQKQESDDRFIRNRERKLEGQEELLELQRELTPKLAPTGGAV
jgi:hypothetical protein